MRDHPRRQRGYGVPDDLGDLPAPAVPRGERRDPRAHRTAQAAVVPAPPAPEQAGAEAVLGLDIGGTKLAAGVVDTAGRTRSFLVIPSYPRRGPRAELDRLFALGRQAVAGQPPDGPTAVRAVGIGCGGPLDPVRGVLLCPLHLPGWRDVPVTAWAQEAFGLPAVLDNDGTAAAAGEHRFGAGTAARNLVYLTLSTGVGGGAVVDGRVYRGAAGNGGEPGHISIDRNGRPCRGCGRRGCLEAYVSGTSIAERAREALAGGAVSILSALDEVTAADVDRAAAAGDPVAAAVWEQTTEALAIGLTSIVNLLEPELVVLGGGVTRAGERLLGPVREAVRRQAMGPAARAVRIVAATLGDRVGVAGAAAVAFERLVFPGTEMEGTDAHGR
ncbi:MAG TPA: ROK family protein [Micromonosporaceae bacterium]|nr:ROK family protein [Micromonosporaceae bacterium]